MSRRIRTPDQPAGPLGHGGSRPHYYAEIDHYINGDERVDVPEGPDRNIHYKQSKYGNHDLSKLEAAFSELWVLMVNDGQNKRTAKPYLAFQDPNDATTITGFASERVPNWHSFQDHPELKQWDKVNKEDFAATSMTAGIFEEDDWHRGNIGTTSNLNDAEIRIVKIDHDMSFYQSIYSRLGVGGRAGFHPGSKNRHHLTPKDLVTFPVPTSEEYRPHYWPGVKTTGHPNKNYGYGDVRKMREMSANADYIKHKYFYLLKFLMLSKEFLSAAIAQHLDPASPMFDLVLNTVMERQAEMKTVALSTPQFRAMLNDHRAEYWPKLQAHLTDYRTSIQNAGLNLPTENQFNDLCNQSNISSINNDTPLHTAIRSGCFRFDETLARYKQDINTTNLLGETPLKLALATGVNMPVTAERKAIAKFLKANGAKLAPGDNSYNTFMATPLDNPSKFHELSALLAQNDRANALAQIQALTQPELINLFTASLRNRQHSAVIELIKTEWNTIPNRPENETFSARALIQLRIALTELRQDTSMTLKMKKDAAILAFKTIMPELNADQLRTAREILQHDDYKFIKQLTSRTEMVRLWRGAYGVTSTYKTIANMMINRSNQLQRAADNAHKQEARQNVREIKQNFKDLCGFFARHSAKYNKLQMAELPPVVVAAAGA